MTARMRTTRRTAMLVALGLLAAAGAGASGAASPSGKATMNSTESRGPYALDQLKPLIPARIGAWERTGQRFPMESSALPPPPTVVNTYRNGAATATLTVTDGGGDPAMLDAAQWKGPPNRRETDDGREFVYREGRRTVREIDRRTPPAREVVLLLANGLIVSASGDGIEMAALKALASGLALDAAEALPRPPR